MHTQQICQTLLVPPNWPSSLWIRQEYQSLGLLSAYVDLSYGAGAVAGLKVISYFQTVELAHEMGCLLLARYFDQLLVEWFPYDGYANSTLYLADAVWDVHNAATTWGSIALMSSARALDINLMFAFCGKMSPFGSTGSNTASLNGRRLFNILGCLIPGTTLGPTTSEPSA